MALAFEGKPVFITDSGDNVTSGAMGANTTILKQVLAPPNLTKKVLFAAINDPAPAVSFPPARSTKRYRRAWAWAWTNTANPWS